MQYKSKRSFPSLGKLQYNVSLYVESLENNVTGIDTNYVLEFVKSFPARITTFAGSKYRTDMQQVNETTHRMHVRYGVLPPLENNHLFIWDNRKFRFLRYQDLDENKRWCLLELRELSAEDVNLG
jgi:hypothetical protein